MPVQEDVIIDLTAEPDDIETLAFQLDMNSAYVEITQVTESYTAPLEFLEPPEQVDQAENSLLKFVTVKKPEVQDPEIDEVPERKNLINIFDAENQRQRIKQMLPFINHEV